MLSQNTQLTRRTFVTGLGAAAAMFGLAACGTAQHDDPYAAFGADGKLRVGMEAAYAPFNWQELAENDNTIPIDNVPGAFADGYDVQVAKRIAPVLGLEPVAVKLEWDGLIDALNQGQIDCIIAGMTATEERRQLIDFTEPYYVGTYCLVVRKDGKYADATSLADFSGAAVLGQRDTLLDEKINEIPEVKHLKPVKTVRDQINRLDAGDCDAITFDSVNVPGIVRANQDFVGIVFEEGKGFSESVPVNVGIAKGRDDIVVQINDVLAAFSVDEREKLLLDVVERQPMS